MCVTIQTFADMQHVQYSWFGLLALSALAKARVLLLTLAVFVVLGPWCSCHSQGFDLNPSCVCCTWPLVLLPQPGFCSKS